MMEIIKGCFKNKIMNLLFIVQVVLVISYLFTTYLSIQDICFSKNETEKQFKSAYDNLIYIETTDLSKSERKKLHECIDGVKDDGAVDKIAFYNQGVVQSKKFNNKSLFECTVSKEFFDLSEIKLKEGTGFSEWEDKDSLKPVVIGNRVASKYKLKVGDEFKTSDGKVKVTGIIKKKSKWFLSSIDEGTIIGIDKAVFKLADEDYESVIKDYYLKVSEKADINKVVEEINAFSKDSKIVLKASTLRNVVEKNYNENIDTNINWLLFAIFFVIVVSIGTSMLIITRLYSRRREIGIRMACGYSPFKLFKIYMGENVLMLFISYIIVCITMKRSVGSGVSSFGGCTMYSGRYFSKEAVLVSGLGILFMAIPSGIVLAAFIRKFKPKNLIGGNE